ncbi:MAG: N-acetylmuramoyl-L-alanine amidase [Clostridiales Family XIII bacterium]|jgi:N-acetylmuramoyl-L-alanine amidase|nr:N-acetylmuramoyl-L-alanine amidase [Clostridiales Family XIII bacterium]
MKNDAHFLPRRSNLTRGGVCRRAFCARRAAALLLALCFAWAFPLCAAGAEASLVAEPLASADAPAVLPVSSEEIAEGLAFCAEFPVGLTLDGLPVESDVPPFIVRERTLIPARALFERMGASVSWDDATRQVAVSTTAAGIILTIDVFEYAINGNIFDMEVPPLIHGDRTMIPVRVVAEALGYGISWDESTRTVVIASPPPAEAPSALAEDSAQEGGSPAPDAISRGGSFARADLGGALPQLDPAFAGFSVVIDAGHGGSDPGALGKENGQTLLFEKDVNLDVALRLETYLRAAGFSVYMIRSDDVTVDRYARPEIANAQGAQLYISIHNNSSKKPEVSGTSTYYYNKEWAAAYPLDSETLAASVQKAVSAYTGLPDLGIHDGPAYIVLNRTQMPAVIVEGAFLSNASDLALMLTDAYRESYAFGVAVGLTDALNSRAPAAGGLDNMMPVGL